MTTLAGQLDLFAEPVAAVVSPLATDAIGSYQPREYQATAINRSFEIWDSGVVGSLARIPTGGGKTFVGALIADLWTQRSDDHRVLILAHERQLITQFADEIKDILGEVPAIEMGDIHCRGTERIIVASRQTLQTQTDKFGDEYTRLFKFNPEKNWLLILDEAHRWAMKLKSCAPIINHFAQNPESRRLGLTATPERSDKTGFDKLFPEVAIDYRLYDLAGGSCAVRDGWAVPYDQRFVTVEGVDFKNIREVAKDFDKNELERVLSEQETLAKLVGPTLELVEDRRTLIFSPGVDMAKAVALYINAKLGYEAAFSLDGNVPDEERRDTYKRHQRGDFQFMSVCGLCREGYNDPGIQAVAIFRPTKSRSLAEQMKGRGCRPLRGVVKAEMTAAERREAIAASDKPNCMIVDLVGVTGLADCASTAHILGESIPDEVIERANVNALKKSGPIDMVDEIRHATEEIEQERRTAQQRKEEAIAARLKRLEEERKAREEMQRSAKLEADIRYHAMSVGLGQGGKVNASDKLPNGASQSQINYIGMLGIDLQGVPITKKQASRIIGQLKAGVDVAEVKRVNRLPENVGAPRASTKQLNFMTWKKIPIPPCCTKKQASDLIDAFKNPKPAFTPPIAEEQPYRIDPDF